MTYFDRHEINFFNRKLVYVILHLHFHKVFLYGPVTHKNKKVKVSGKNAISDPNSHCLTYRPTLASVTSKQPPQNYLICSFWLKDISTPDFSTPDFSTMNFSTPDFWTMNFWTMGLKSLWLKSLGLKSPGLKCSLTF